MQQILHNSNKTKTESIKQNLKPKVNTEKPLFEGSITISSLFELEAEVRKLALSADAKEMIAEDLLKNASESWPAPREMSVYESLIERVTTNEKSLIMIIEAFRDLSKLAGSLELELSKLVQFILSQQKITHKSLNNLKDELKKKREEIRELKEMQNELEYISKKQEYLLGLLLVILLVLLVICISLCYCYKNILKTRRNKNTILLCSRSYERLTTEKVLNR